MKESDIFEKIQSLIKQGVVIDCIAVNQAQNGYQEQVAIGDMPLITYTVEVMDVSLSNMLYAESCDSFKEALENGIKAAEKYLSKG